VSNLLLNHAPVYSTAIGVAFVSGTGFVPAIALATVYQRNKKDIVPLVSYYCGDVIDNVKEMGITGIALSSVAKVASTAYDLGECIYDNGVKDAALLSARKVTDTAIGIGGSVVDNGAIVVNGAKQVISSIVIDPIIPHVKYAQETGVTGLALVGIAKVVGVTCNVGERVIGGVCDSEAVKVTGTVLSSAATVAFTVYDINKEYAVDKYNSAVNKCNFAVEAVKGVGTVSIVVVVEVVGKPVINGIAQATSSIFSRIGNRLFPADDMQIDF